MGMMQFGLRDWATREPARPAVQFVDGTVTSYGEMEAMANRFVHLFRRHGLVRGDHVAVVLGNGPAILAAVWAAYRAGLYLTPISHAFSGREIAYVIVNCQARMVLADQRVGQALAGLAAGLGPDGPVLYALGGAIPGFRALEPELAALPATPAGDESPGALMLYSSGTTGAPKGIWRPLPTAEAVGSGPPPFARDLLQLFDFDPDMRYLSPAPLYHAAPLRFSLATLAAGGCAVVMDKFDASLALDLLERERITHSQWVPTMLQRLLNLPAERRAGHRAPAHRVALHAAAPCPPVVKRAMIEWWGPILREYYAGSESVGLCEISSQEWLERPGSVGRARKGVLHILDETGRELATGETGTIFFSGIPAFTYFGEPEKTATRTSPQGYQTFGDVGYVDEQGYLFIADRLDDTIISGGVNVYPQEIENALIEAPGVAECGVVGLPDADFGERPVAFVVATAAARRDPVRLCDELAAFCRDRLGRIKQPREFRIVDELPRSAAGKLLRRELRKTS